LKKNPLYQNGHRRFQRYGSVYRKFKSHEAFAGIGYK
jgi:hypothetical protein